MYIGVDVGGTNTDAVLMDGVNLAGAVKVPTSADVTSGIVASLTELLPHLPRYARVDAVMVGTTHFTNALLERRDLSPTAVVRLSLPATHLLPPLVDWPEGLKEAVGGHTYMVGGGHEFDGREIAPWTVTDCGMQYAICVGTMSGLLLSPGYSPRSTLLTSQRQRTSFRTRLRKSGSAFPMKTGEWASWSVKMLRR